jgi:hypothetical protein
MKAGLENEIGKKEKGRKIGRGEMRELESESLVMRVLVRKKRKERGRKTEGRYEIVKMWKTGLENESKEKEKGRKRERRNQILKAWSWEC